MPRLTLALNPAEDAAMREAAVSVGVTRQALLRAIFYRLYGHDGDRAAPFDPHAMDVRAEAEEMARQRQTIPSDEQPGQQKGNSRDDYQRALSEAGTISGAARLLGVNDSTAREMVALYGLRPRGRKRKR